MTALNQGAMTPSSPTPTVGPLMQTTAFIQSAITPPSPTVGPLLRAMTAFFQSALTPSSTTVGLLPVQTTPCAVALVTA